jgi:hypothetical protein
MLAMTWLLMASKRRITVTLDEDTYQFFSRWAEEDDRTVPYLIARIAAQYAKQQANGKESRQQNGSAQKKQTPSPGKGKRAKQTDSVVTDQN